MKKLLLATMIAAAGAANAQVGLSGKASYWYSTTETGAATTRSIAAEPTSNIAITATEKLGMGLTARAVVETSLSGNTVDGGNDTRLGDRQSTVGLVHNLGSLDIGRNVHTQFLAISNNDAFSTLIGSIAGDVHNLRGLRLNNAAFAAFTPMKGVSVNVDRSEAGAAAEATVAGANVSVGPVSVAVARFEQGAERSDVLAANVKWQNTTLFYSHSDNKGIVNTKGDLVGARQQLGPMAFKASYGKTDKDVKAWNVGADYALSKRTEVGIAYKNVDLLADVKQVSVGLTHKF